MIRKLFLLVMGMLGLAGLIVLVGPSFVDWNSYRPELESRLGRLTGRSVELSGPVAVAMLPSPMVSLAKVRISALSGATDPVLADVEKLDLHLALLPLLTGSFQVTSLSLERPVVHLEILKDGRHSWDLSGKVTGSDISFDHVRVDNGSISLHDDASGLSRVFEAVNARLQAAEDGAVQASADLVSGGLPFLSELNAGALDENGARPVRLSVEMIGGNTKASFAGVVSLDPVIEAIGNVRAEGSDFGATLALLTSGRGAPVPVLAQAFALRATLDAKLGSITAENLLADLGNNRVTGQLGFDNGHASLFLQAHAPHVTDWRPLFQQASLDALRKVAATVPVTLDVALDSGEDATMTTLALKGSASGGAVTVDALEAHLPGGLALTGTGALDGSGVMTGEVSATAPDLRATLTSLGAPVAHLPLGLLTTASVQASLGGTLAAPRLQKSSIDVDGQHYALSGGFDPAGKVPLHVELSSDRLDIDTYAPVVAALMPASGWPGASLVLRLGSVTLRGQTIQGLAADVTLSADGGLELGSVRIGDVAGAHATLSGQIHKLVPLQGLDLSGEAEVPDAPALAKALSALAGSAPALEPVLRVLGEAGALSGTVHASGAPDALAFDGTVQGAGGSIEFSGSHAAGKAGVKARARLADISTALDRFIPEAKPLSIAGPADVYAEIGTDEAGVSIDKIQGTLSDMSVVGKARVDLAGPEPALQVELQTGDLDLGRVVVAGLMPEASGALQHWHGSVSLTSRAMILGHWRCESPALRLHVEGGTVTLDAMDGSLNGGRLGLTGAFTPANDKVPGLHVSGTITLAQMPLTGPVFGEDWGDVSGGTLDLEASAKTTAANPLGWAGWAGTGRVVMSDATLTGLALPAIIDHIAAGPEPSIEVNGSGEKTWLQQALSAGQTPFSRLEADVTLNQGTLRSDSVRLTAPTGRITAKGSIDLGKDRVDLVASVAPAVAPTPPPLLIHLSGPLATPERHLQTAEFMAMLSGTSPTPATISTPTPPPVATPSQDVAAAKPAPAPAPAPVKKAPSVDQQGQSFIRGVLQHLQGQ